jgi:Arylsulfotransferase (ASST)
MTDHLHSNTDIDRKKEGDNMKHWISKKIVEGAVRLFICLLFSLSAASAQEAFEGNTLISPLNSSNTILVDMDGTTIKTWHGASEPGHLAYLMPDDSILRPCRDYGGSFFGGGVGGRIQRIDTNDTVVWDYYCSTSTYQQHHDIQPMPNGNILMICWEAKSEAEAEAMGRESQHGPLWPHMIVEVEPSGSSGGTIVWEWHVWDHLIQDVDPSKPGYGVVADHPELLDINLGDAHGSDWEHLNAIDYNPNLDQIVISSHTLHEYYIIDHSTTTQEAAGHTGGNCGKGGDFLYRWGNPQNYDRGSSTDRQFYVIHGVNWIDDGLPGAGNILILNNGDRSGSSNDYSSAEEYVTPLEPDGNYTLEAGQAYGPDAPVWSYSNPGTFYSRHLGGCFRLPNGNTLITEGVYGDIFEVTASGTEVWDHSVSGELARVQRYWTATTPTATPPPGNTPTPTPAIGGGMILTMDDIDLQEGDLFHLYFTLGPQDSAMTMDAYVILGVGDMFWCWPSWNTIESGLDYTSYDIPAGDIQAFDVLNFSWPGVEGSASGLVFYGAAFTEGTFDVIGDYQVIAFGYN